MLRLAVSVACALAILAGTTPASATDDPVMHCGGWVNSSGQTVYTACDTHWHSRPVQWHRSPSLPSSWANLITNAGAEWTRETSFDLQRGSDVSHSNPDGTGRIVWWGRIPSSWQGGCPITDTLACTRGLAVSDGVNLHYSDIPTGTYRFHMLDADTVFNEEYGFDTTCNPLFYDIQEIMVHEFGHWAWLEHSTLPADRMYTPYTTCVRELNFHEIGVANRLYSHAGH